MVVKLTRFIGPFKRGLRTCRGMHGGAVGDTSSLYVLGIMGKQIVASALECWQLKVLHPSLPRLEGAWNQLRFRV